jgi:branched-chain amino acid transport system permease protein
MSASDLTTSDGLNPARAAGAYGSPLFFAVAAFLVLVPLFAAPFLVFQVGAYGLILGTIALSLMFLAGYGGMVSLSQMSAAGLAGYLVAILGANSLGTGLDWPWWLVVALAVAASTLFSIGAGLLAVRTEGIYTIMITLAIGVAFFLLTQQNYAIFNGHSGFAGIAPPAVFGLDWRGPVPFYYLSLAVSAAAYLAVVYIARSPFGLGLQAIRDNPRRMRALGFHVAAHRVAAYGLSGVIAGFGGVLLVWFNGRISPGTGGIRHPAGAYLGALFFVLIDTFAIDLMGAERFNTLIGLLFLAIVLFSPDGLLGLWQKARRALDGGKDKA